MISQDGQNPQAGNEVQRLNGWKEIASYLGKGVRTVQRWETEYQLPIRRIGREGGEIVFAFKNEIDAWSASGRRTKALDSEADPESRPATTPAPARYWQLPAVVVFALLAVGGAYFSKTRESSLSEEPVDARIEFRSLIAVNESGKQLWRRELDFEPTVSAYSSTIDEALGMKRIRVADLDNDGANEVVLSIASVRGVGPQGYRVFSADGTLRYAIEPTDRVTFGDVEYAPPWAVYRMFIIPNPDGSQSIWTAFIHSLYFPTLLLELDDSGRIKSKYWSNGYIEDIAVVERNGRRRVFVGGTHNDTRGASLAVFEYGSVTGSAPATLDKFRCKTCEPGGPSTFIVFPRQCIAEALAGQAAAQQMKFDESGRVFLFAGEGPRNAGGDFAAGIWYTIEQDFRAASMQFAVGSSVLHARLESEGRLNHRFSIPAHLSQPGTILIGKGNGFTSTPVSNLTPDNIVR